MGVGLLEQPRPQSECGRWREALTSVENMASGCINAQKDVTCGFVSIIKSLGLWREIQA